MVKKTKQTKPVKTKSKALEEQVKKLVREGKDNGFITQEQILAIFARPEANTH